MDRLSPQEREADFASASRFIQRRVGPVGLADRSPKRSEMALRGSPPRWESTPNLVTRLGSCDLDHRPSAGFRDCPRKRLYALKPGV